jgi:hypothetical protein
MFGYQICLKRVDEFWIFSGHHRILRKHCTLLQRPGWLLSMFEEGMIAGFFEFLPRVWRCVSRVAVKMHKSRS